MAEALSGTDALEPRGDSITFYQTVRGGRDQIEAVEQSAAKVGWKTGTSRPPEGVTVEFIDWPFTHDDPSFEEHLQNVEEYRPEVAVAPDVEDGRPLSDVLDMADQLAEYAGDVVVVPKETHPTEIPDDYRVGMPLANYGSDAPWDVVDYLDCDRVHLLGGSPTVQRRVAVTFVPVVSADGASIVKTAQIHKIWRWNGEYVNSWLAVSETDLYDRIRTSLDNAVRALNFPTEMADERPPSITSNPTPMKEYSEEIERMNVGPPPCQEPDCSKPAVHDEQHGRTYCQDHLEAFEWVDEANERDRKAVDAIENDLRADGGTAVPERDPADAKFTVVLVGCGSAKQDFKDRAKDLYTSGYFEKKRKYAETVGDQWYILSAKHHLLLPDEFVEPYDEKLTSSKIEAWREAATTDDELGTIRRIEDSHVEVLAGKEYIEAVAPWLDEHAHSWDAPTEGLGIGERMAWLKENTPDADEADDGDDRPTPKHFGDYRREKVERLEDTPHLEPIESFDSIGAMVEAIEEIHVPGYSSPPEKTLQKLQANFERLPDDEARRYYLSDYKLTRTINAARRAFNEWVGRKKRYDEMPGWAEAGPSNYPVRKHSKRRDSADTARETLDEKLDRLNGRTKGAFRRALKKAGHSEAELNEQEREATREERREAFEKGDVVLFRNPRLHTGVVHRVNQKSVRIEYPNERRGGTKPMSDEPEPDTLKATVQLDSDHLKRVPTDEVYGFTEPDAVSVREALIETGLLPEEPEGDERDEPSHEDDEDESMSTTDTTDDSSTERVPPEEIGAWTQTNRDPLKYTHDESDVLEVREHTGGYSAWFQDEGFGQETRFGFYEEKEDAENRIIKAAQQQTIEGLRGQARADPFEGVTLKPGDLTKRFYPAVKSAKAETLARHYDSYSEFKQASDAELLALDGIGKKTVEGIREKQAELGEDAAPDEIEEHVDRRRLGGYKKLAEGDDGYRWTKTLEDGTTEWVIVADGMDEAKRAYVAHGASGTPWGKLKPDPFLTEGSRAEALTAAVEYMRGGDVPDADEDEPAADEADDGDMSEAEFVAALEDLADDYLGWSVTRKPGDDFQGDRGYAQLEFFEDQGRDSALGRNRHHSGDVVIKTNDQGDRTYQTHARIIAASTGKNFHTGADTGSSTYLYDDELANSTRREAIEEIRGFFEHGENTNAADWFQRADAADDGDDREEIYMAALREKAERERDRAAADEDESPEFPEEPYYGWHLTDMGGPNTYAYKHRHGQIVLVERYGDGWAADLQNPKWDDYTKWLTDADAREQQPGRGTGHREREPVSLHDAWRAADDEMARIYQQTEHDTDDDETEAAETPAESEEEGDVELDIPDSEIRFSDDVGALPGVGKKGVEEAASLGIETVGEWWNAGCPFQVSSKTYYTDLIRAILGSPDVDESDAESIMRVFTGATNGAVYGRDGERLGGSASALFGQLDWQQAAWAWFRHDWHSRTVGKGKNEKTKYTAHVHPAATEQQREDRLQNVASFIATGDDVPRDVLTFEPHPDGLDSNAWRSVDESERTYVHTDDSEGNTKGVETTFLSGPHAVSKVGGTNKGRLRYHTDEVPGDGNSSTTFKSEPIEFIGAIFGVDYSDTSVASKYAEVVLDVARGSGPGLLLLHHPNGDAHAVVETDAIVMPEDFDLDGDTYDPVAEWGETVAADYREREAAMYEAYELPEWGGRSPMAEALREEPLHHDYDEREDLVDRDHFESVMGTVYDPTTEGTADDDTDDNPYAVWPEVPITLESLKENFDAEIDDVQVAMMWNDSYGTIRSLAGATAPLLRVGRGVGDDEIRELFGTNTQDDDLTVHHAQERMGNLPDSTDDTDDDSAAQSEWNVGEWVREGPKGRAMQVDEITDVGLMVEYDGPMGRRLIPFDSSEYDRLEPADEPGEKTPAERFGFIKKGYGHHKPVEPETGEEARFERDDGHAVTVYELNKPEGRNFEVQSDRGAVKQSLGKAEVAMWVERLAARADTGYAERDDVDTRDDVTILRQDANIGRDKGAKIIDLFGSLDAVASGVLEAGGRERVTDLEGVGDRTAEKLVEWAADYTGTPNAGTPGDDGESHDRVPLGDLRRGDRVDITHDPKGSVLATVIEVDESGFTYRLGDDDDHDTGRVDYLDNTDTWLDGNGRVTDTFDLASVERTATAEETAYNQKRYDEWNAEREQTHEDAMAALEAAGYSERNAQGARKKQDIDDLSGIGRDTAKKVYDPSIRSIAHQAHLVAGEHNDAEWTEIHAEYLREVGRALPSQKALDSLTDALEVWADAYDYDDYTDEIIREAFEAERGGGKATDVQAWLTDHGINGITAHHLATEYPTVAAVREAVEAADDLTDLKGVGDAASTEVRAAFDGTTEEDEPPTPDPEDYQKAMSKHLGRSPESIATDEAIQAREQTADFEKWAAAPNQMDFVGVDSKQGGLLGFVYDPTAEFTNAATEEEAAE